MGWLRQLRGWPNLMRTFFVIFFFKISAEPTPAHASEAKRTSKNEGLGEVFEGIGKSRSDLMSGVGGGLGGLVGIVSSSEVDVCLWLLQCVASDLIGGMWGGVVGVVSSSEAHVCLWLLQCVAMVVAVCCNGCCSVLQCVAVCCK